MPVIVSGLDDGNRVEAAAAFLETFNGTIRFLGKNGLVRIADGCAMAGAQLVIGDGCTIDIGERSHLSALETFMAPGAHIVIGSGVGFTHHTRLYCHESGKIALGDGCLIASGTLVTVSDMHSIVDAESGERLNRAADVTIGERVWIAEGARVMKGVSIGAGSIIGAGAVVTGDIPAKSLAVGVPAKVIRQGVTWRHDLI